MKCWESMSYLDIQYRQNTISFLSLLDFYRENSKEFTPPLDSHVDIEKYVRKIIDNAQTSEAWVNGKLVGFVAFYCNNELVKEAYITSVIVISEYREKRIAINLLNIVIQYVRDMNFQKLVLEVNEKNESAYMLYLKLGFVELNRENDSIYMQKVVK